MEFEKLYFNFEDTNIKKTFKIDLSSILVILKYLIKEKKFKDLPEDVISEINKKYYYDEKQENLNITLEEIDTFDYENEKKRLIQFEKEEKDYEKYLKDTNTRSSF